MARAFLLIADIGGYTRFMTIHRINLAHAQYVVAQLLEAVIDAARGLELAKLEGDAAFFYAKVKDGAAGPPRADETIAAIRAAFLRRQAELVVDRVCTCDGCTQAGDLKLKFVAHVGEVAFQRVKRFTELAGVDVILVHRLLKNTVPLGEYLLLSEPARDALPEPLRGAAVPHAEELEGLGRATTFYVDAELVSPRRPPEGVPSFFRRWWGWLRMTWRSLPYFLGLRRSCDGFRNTAPIFGEPPPPSLPPSTLAVPSRRGPDEPA